MIRFLLHWVWCRKSSQQFVQYLPVCSDNEPHPAVWKHPISSVYNLWQTGWVASSCPDLGSSDYTIVSVRQFWMYKVGRRNQPSESTAVRSFVEVCDAEDKDWRYYLLLPHLQSKQKTAAWQKPRHALSTTNRLWRVFFFFRRCRLSLAGLNNAVKKALSLCTAPPPSLRNDGAVEDNQEVAEEPKSPAGPERWKIMAGGVSISIRSFLKDISPK